MKHYTPKQINQIKQEIRTGKPLAIIADELAKEWKRPVSGVYNKVLTLSKMTRKIKNVYVGPVRRPYKKSETSYCTRHVRFYTYARFINGKL